ncbi:transcription termination factor MTERF6, chloroplastic/mitochondrial-like [Cucurbita moschata]|uniref:Transcription termination factor MTERF6, chloroplastic/mitochondrial-like n=1 Tax=Cucurbita moschata TaxID=3662 RepID=A0A6J1ER69_CUCMO|nr:transcription termination factor MTERF6, chloroplastic/mitochondrial-like [Cucurbita moschata]
MSNFLCKTLLQVRHLTTISPYPKLRCVQSLHFNYSTVASDSHSFTVSYLINSCSLSPESASSASKLVSFTSPEKPDLVISFFKNHGFSIANISFIIWKYPRILLSNPNGTLLPKLEFLYTRGASSSEVTKIISKAPKILMRSVDEHLVPAFDFLKGYLGSNERTIASIKRFPSIIADIHQKQLNGSVRMLLDAGVPEARVVFFLFYQPRMFTMALDRFREILEDVKKMGFDPSKSSFVQAVFAIRAMSKSTWVRKLGIYKRWGLSEEQILAAFRSHPWCMTLSEEKIMLAMDFFVNKLGWETAAIVRSPLLLSFSLKKRTIPRASVLLFLFQKGLTKKKTMLVKPYMYTETQFLQKFVHPHLKEAPQLSKLYRENVDGGIIDYEI